jgi:hypothetical protein
MKKLAKHAPQVRSVAVLTVDEMLAESGIEDLSQIDGNCRPHQIALFSCATIAKKATQIAETAQRINELNGGEEPQDLMACLGLLAGTMQ